MAEVPQLARAGTGRWVSLMTWGLHSLAGLDWRNPPCWRPRDPSAPSDLINQEKAKVLTHLDVHLALLPHIINFGMWLLSWNHLKR